jgi:cytochrome P450
MIGGFISQVAASDSTGQAGPTTHVVAVGVVLVSAVALLIAHHYYCVHTYFKRRGLAGPPPLPLVGNMISLLFVEDRMSVAREWRERYGKVYGVFHGTEPRYVLNDAELLRQICIDDFDSMPNRYVDALLNRYERDSILFARNDQWRRLRVLQSATFTSAKIERMFPLLDQCADRLLAGLSKQLDSGGIALLGGGGKTTVNLSDIYSSYTMDAIASVACAIKLERKPEARREDTAMLVTPRDGLASLATRLFEASIPSTLARLVMPGWLLKMIGLGRHHMHRCAELEDHLRPVIGRRRKSPNNEHPDHVQMLVDVALEDRLELNAMDDKENHHASLDAASLEEDRAKLGADIGWHDTPAGARLAEVRLTDQEIVSSAIALLMAGTDTTATLLTNCTYALAFHLDVQQRLYETVKMIARRDEQTGEYAFDYDELTSCEYLDAVVAESLRMLSPIVEFDRVVSKDYRVEKYNLQLRKGDKLQLAFYSIMNDPDYWSEPAKFSPERFMGANKERIVPGSYCPFGLGPRHCLGMRLSLTMAKLALAKVLMRFKFFHASGTCFPPKNGTCLALNVLKSPVADLSPRIG